MGIDTPWVPPRTVSEHLAALPFLLPGKPISWVLTWFLNFSSMLINVRLRNQYPILVFPGCFRSNACRFCRKQIDQGMPGISLEFNILRNRLFHFHRAQYSRWGPSFCLFPPNTSKLPGHQKNRAPVSSGTARYGTSSTCMGTFVMGCGVLKKILKRNTLGQYSLCLIFPLKTDTSTTSTSMSSWYAAQIVLYRWENFSPIHSTPW